MEIDNMNDSPSKLPPPITRGVLEALFEEKKRKEQQRNEEVDAAQRICAHRIHFSTTHKNALRLFFPTDLWQLILPFPDTVSLLLRENTHIELSSSGNQSRKKEVVAFLSIDESDIVEKWIKRQGTRVFLRDCLHLSVAMDLNMQDGQRTEMGNLEYKAKNQNNDEACNTLACKVAEAIRDLPFYRSADIIVPAPVSLGNQRNLPESVARLVGESVDKPCCPVARFTHRAQPMKNVPLEQKLDNLEAGKLVVEGDSLEGKSVILLDDKYQSGATANFVAWKLQEAGVRHVYGLFLVKTMRDTDNQ